MGMFRTLTLAAAAALALALPARAIDIQELTSPGGIDFWLVEEPQIPIVSLEIDFRGGSRLDPDDRLGVAQMMAGLMDEGAGELDAVAFAKARDELAARYGFSSGRNTFSVSARMLVETLDDSVALLATAMSAPRFDEEPVGRVRNQMLSAIASDSTDPQAIASRTWYARAFPDHPYGRPAKGTLDTVAAIQTEDLRAAHSRLLTRANAIIGIVGDISGERAGAMIDTLLADLPEGEPTEPEAVDSVPPPGTEVVEVDKPQSVAIFGHEGLPRKDDDFIAASVMNHILGGGGFVSRLMTEVREERGLAYSVYSYLSPIDGAPLYLGGVSTANERVSESLDIIRAEWARMAEGDVTEEELQKAKKYMTGAFPLRFDSNAKIAGYLVGLQREELGANYINERNGLIEAVTLDDLKRVAKRLLKPEALSVVVVGQPAGL